jgi:hypothetical protein
MGGGLSLTLGYQVHDVVRKKIFRAHGGRDQEGLVVKESKYRKAELNPDMAAGTSDSRCNECSNATGISDRKADWGLTLIHPGMSSPLCSGIFCHSCCHTALSFGPRDFQG